jgi:serine/threonine protein kinase/tetratricopeptide (TPR) repeat protein
MLDERARELAEAAVALPRHEREAFVRARAGSAAEASAALKLLEQHDSRTLSLGSGPGDTSFGSPMAAAPPGERAGDVVGSYKLLEVLGEGGFGTVWLAERRAPMVQRVALKVIKPGMDSKAVIARFEQERQALAVMDHPNVARVFDAGATAGGRPYFVMELVQGEPLTLYCDRRRMTVRQRLELFIPVCEAVQHAHTKGVIHRDLKPSNVLVAERDGKPIPKVIDFGVAKSISHALSRSTIFTEMGQIIGTPEYMSPEQAEQGALDIDTRTDVYSLGVLLYELLTGGLPFEPQALRKAGYAEIQRIIREVDPPRPSTKLTSMGDAAVEAAKHRHTRLDALAKELRSELEWIPLKAMRKERDRRYRSPSELADDIRNYLSGRALLAGPESNGYRAKKFLRRHRGPVLAGAMVVLALVGGVVGTSVGMMRANDAAERERLAKEEAQDQRAMAVEAASKERAAREAEAKERARAEAASGFLTTMFASIDPEKAQGRDITVKEIIDDAAGKVGEAFKDEPAVEASLRETLGETYGQMARYAEAREQFTRTLELRTRVLGAEHRETLVTKFNLAAMNLQLGDLTTAGRLLAETMESRRKVLGPEHSETLLTQSLLGYVKQLEGDNEGALQIYRETLALQKKVAGPDAKDTVETMSSVADVLQDLGRLDEARAVAEELVASATRLQGPEGRLTLQARSILAAILKDLGKYDESEKILREVLETKRKVFGPDHTEVFTTTNILALTLEQLKKQAEAVGLLADIVERATKVLGPEHDTTLTYRANLGRMKQLSGDLEGSEREMREVLEIRERVNGKDAQPTLVLMNNLGLLLLDQKKPAEAEPIFREMLAGLSAILPPEHWMFGAAKVNVGECLSDQGKYEEAEKLMVEGYEHLAKVLPAGHSRVSGAAKALATMYEKWQKPEKAAEWKQRGG